MSFFDITYQNVRGLRTKLSEFSNSLATINSDIFCATETWLNDDIDSNEFGNQDYLIYRKDRQYDISNTTRGGGCLLAVKSNLIVHRVSEYETTHKNLEDLWVRIKINENEDLYICAVYVSPTVDCVVLENHLDKLKRISLQVNLNSKILIIGDYNLPNIFWVDSNNSQLPLMLNTTEKAQCFLETFNFCNFSQFNDIKNEYNKTLDLVLSNFETDAIKVTKSNFIMVEEDKFHPTLQIQVKSSLSFMNERNFRKFNFRRGRYNEIRSELRNMDWNFLDDLPLDNAVSEFYNIIEEVKTKYVPLYTKRKTYPPWYTNDVKNLLKKKSILRKKWKKSGNDHHYREFSNLRSICKAKTAAAFDEFVEHVESNLSNNIKVFWSYTKSKRHSNSYPNSFKHDGVESEKPDEICQMFSNFFQTTYTQSDNNVNNVNMNNTTSNENTDTLCEIQITYNEVEQELSKLNVNKNGGPDGIPSFFINELKTELSTPLSKIFNKSLSIGIFPGKFKESYITPIFKSGTKSDVTNYRPVNILNTFSKVFEKLVYNKLLIKLLDVIDSKQHGFMKNKSTVTNLIEYTNFIANDLNLGNEIHAVYTDFSKAFDTVNINILLKKLSSYGIGGNLLKWFESYLRDRKLRVAFCGYTSEAFTTPSGVPQGSVLGPFLFNIYINDLCQNLKCNYLLYADDLKIFQTIKTYRDFVLLQSDLNTIHKWCLDNKLTLNINKCVFIVFSNKLNQSDVSYKINNITLNKMSTVKDLGVTFDSKLKFTQHIDNIVAKSYRCLGFIFRLTKKFKNTKCVNLLYNALVRSNLEYASIIWSPHQTTYSYKIERVQKKFTRHIFFKNNSTPADYTIRLKTLELISLENRRKLIDMCFLHKIMHNKTPISPEQLQFRQSQYPNRRNFVFNPPSFRTYYGTHVHVLNRLQSLSSNEFTDIDIHNARFNMFKSVFGLAQLVKRWTVLMCVAMVR